MWQLRLAAFLEVTTVLLAGNLLSRGVNSLLGLTRSRDLINALPAGTAPDFLRMAWITSLDLTIKYGILFGLAFLIGWWHRRRPLRAYGLGLAGRSWGYHLKVGVILFSIAGLIPALLLALAKYVSLGTGPEHWSIFSYEWTFGFWVFMAASSFGLVPIFEELFTRGYFQTRLTEDFGAAGAILITALMFAFSHTQYYRLSVMSLGMLLGIALGSIIMGYIFHRTRSLIAVIVAHAIGNIPVSSLIETALPAVMILIILLFWKRIVAYGRDLIREFAAIESLWATLSGIAAVGIMIAGVLFARLIIVVWLLAGGLLVLIIESRERRERAGVALR